MIDPHVLHGGASSWFRIAPNSDFLAASIFTSVFADGARPGEADAFVTIGLQMYFGDKMLMAQNRARVRCEYGRLPDGRCAEEEVGQTGPGAPGGTGGPGGGGAGPGS